MRRRRGRGKLLWIGGLIVVLFFYLISSFLMGSERKARLVVEEFYEYESNGDYGRSWELLHTEIQERFNRGAYVQDRAHVFNGHFGADTFSYEVSGGKEWKDWRMVKGGDPFAQVYEFQVKQNYHGKYGHFVFVQYVYVLLEDGEWRIVWDYKK